MPLPFPVFDDSGRLGRALNRIVDAVRSHLIVNVVGARLEEGPDGQALIMPFRRNETIRVRIPAGGIGSGTSADCRYYVADHTLSGVTETIEVWNRLDPAVTIGGADAVDGFASWIGPENEYHAINAVCPAPAP